MRFSALSLGLVATMFMAVSARGGPIDDDFGPWIVGPGGIANTVRESEIDVTRSRGIHDTTGKMEDHCSRGDACLSDDGGPLITAPIKRSVRLSRRKLFQRRAGTGAVTDTATPNADTDTVTTPDVVPVEGDEDEDEEDEEENEEDEEELARRKVDEDEDEEDEDEEDEDDKGKRRKRAIVDDEDEEEIDEEEVDEEEVDEEEVDEEEVDEEEVDEEEVDELGDAAPAGRR